MQRRSTFLNVDANNNIMVIYQWFLGENFSLKKSSYRAARIRRSHKFSSYLHTNREDIVNKLGNTKIRFKFVSVGHCYSGLRLIKFTFSMNWSQMKRSNVFMNFVARRREVRISQTKMSLWSDLASPPNHQTYSTVLVK